jgi:hypothetical protein
VAASVRQMYCGARAGSNPPAASAVGRRVRR